MPGLSDISVGNFTTIEYSPVAANTYTEVENVQQIGNIPDEKNIIDVPQYNVTYMRKLTGSANAGPVEVVCNMHVGDATFAALEAAYKNNTKFDWKITYRDAEGGSTEETILFTGQIASKSLSSEFDAVRTVTWAVTIDGAVGDVTSAA